MYESESQPLIESHSFGMVGLINMLVPIENPALTIHNLGAIFTTLYTLKIYMYCFWIISYCYSFIS